MTSLIRDVRTGLDTIGRNRNRPYTFAVHVMDSPELSLDLGQNVESWLEQGLVDILVVGMGYLPYAIRIGEWLALGREHDIPVYPSMNTNTFASWQKQISRTPGAWHQAIRAGAAHFWQEGSSGIYLFNVFCMEDRNVGPMPREAVYAPLREVGDPKVLLGLDKLYSIQPVSQSGFCQHGSEASPLPIALDRVERKLPLWVGPDADNPQARFILRILTTDIDPEQRMHLRLNHELLPEPKADDPWFWVELPSKALRIGRNELSIWCDKILMDVARPLIVQQVFLSVDHVGS
jgi:hypothetical protein